MKTHRFVKPVSSHIASHLSPKKKSRPTSRSCSTCGTNAFSEWYRLKTSENYAKSSATERSATGPRGPNSSRCMGLNNNRGTSIDNLLLGRDIYIYIYMYLHVYMHIYTYIHNNIKQICTHICIHICIYIKINK